MKKFDIEIAVGIFILVGILCLGYISIRLGKVDFFGNQQYPVTAVFTTVQGLKKDTVVEIGGVEVGKVNDIRLDKNYNVEVEMLINNNIKLEEDSIASIRTQGLLGEKYVEIAPGGSDEIIQPGGKIFDTEPPIDFEKLIRSFVFGKVDDKEEKKEK